MVDDASTDDTVAVVEACTDPRLRVVRHEQNRGVCPARGSGTRAARGRWIVFLDSDWSLEPGRLRCLAGMAAEAPPDVGIVGGFVRMDTGVLSPRAAPPETPFGFVEYLHWLDTGQAGDWLSCWRREVFDQFSWPEDRRWELGFSVRVSVPWKRWITRQVLAVQSTQCANRLTQDRSSAADRRKMSVAPALARDIDETLQRFGPEFARPRTALAEGLPGDRGRLVLHRRIPVERDPVCLPGLVSPSMARIPGRSHHVRLDRPAVPAGGAPDGMGAIALPAADPLVTAAARRTRRVGGSGGCIRKPSWERKVTGVVFVEHRGNGKTDGGVRTREAR